MLDGGVRTVSRLNGEVATTGEWRWCDVLYYPGPFGFIYPARAVPAGRPRTVVALYSEDSA